MGTHDLNRLLELAGIKKIDEIIKVPPLNVSGIDEFDTSNREEIFKVSGLLVYVDKIGHQNVYTVMDGEETVYQAVFDNVNMPQYGSVYIATRGFMNPAYRGKGIAAKVLVDVRRYTNKVIISDEQLTDDGFQFWMKMQGVLPVKIININTGEVLPVNGNENKIVQHKPEDDRFAFIVETDILSGGRIVESKSVCRSFEYMCIEASEELMWAGY